MDGTIQKGKDRIDSWTNVTKGIPNRTREKYLKEANKL